MDRSVIAVVLAGGVGTRLYPASRSDRPKQFLSLADDGHGASLLERTVDRAGFADEILVSTRAAHAEMVSEHVTGADVVVEPEGKDTAPAMLYATDQARDRVRDRDPDEPEPVVVVLPSDHHVPKADREVFQTAMRRGASVAGSTDRLVTFGIDPSRPESGYGYIQPGTDHGRYREIAEFHEKPDTTTARKYVDRGFLWNSGIFAWTPSALFETARETRLAPLVEALEDDDPVHGFENVDPVSIDHAVMEPAAEEDNAVVVPVEFGWDDLGAWDALARILDQDTDGNVVDVVGHGASNTEEETQGAGLFIGATENVVATDDKHVSLVGVEGLCVVAFDDRVLVVPRKRVQQVRQVVDQLRADGLF